MLTGIISILLEDRKIVIQLLDQIHANDASISRLILAIQYHYAYFILRIFRRIKWI